MKNRTVVLIFATLWAIVAGVWFILAPGPTHENEALHGALETVESLSALLMAVFLLNRTDRESHEISAPLGLGFLSLSILNTVHESLGPGDLFVLLRTLSSLAGGIGFGLLWLPARLRRRLAGPWFVGSVATLSLLLCAALLLFPGLVPDLEEGARFTPFAVYLNILAGVLFLAGAGRLAAFMHASPAIEYPLFSLAGIFFGLSGLAFRYSTLWSGSWWYWHALRLGGSLLMLVLLIGRHLQTLTLLRESLREQREAEQSLRRSSHLTETIINSMNDSISLLDARDYTIIRVNRTFLEEYGYRDESEVVGKHCYEITHARREVCGEPDDRCPLAETFRTGTHAVAEHIHYDRAGEPIYAEVSTSPIRDEQGNVVQVVHVSKDITARKRAEQEREQLLSDIARSNEDLQQFASIASHDLKEPLRMVSSYVQLLARKYQDRLDDKANRYIGYAVDGVDRMNRLIEGLLAYSRAGRSPVEWTLVDTNEVFRQAVANLGAAIRESGASVTHDDLPAVPGDEIQLLQLFQNLIGNAIKYRKQDMKPQVHVSAAADSGMHRFSIRDNGIGIEPRQHERIFQIFQRLHPHDRYSGAGIGLAVCKRIVERHHGRIWLESTPGSGSTFYFTVPVRSVDGKTDHPRGMAA